MNKDCTDSIKFIKSAYDGNAYVSLQNVNAIEIDHYYKHIYFIMGNNPSNPIKWHYCYNYHNNKKHWYEIAFEADKKMIESMLL